MEEKKICPLRDIATMMGYINGFNTQDNHRCKESECAWWDKELKQCAICQLFYLRSLPR